MTPPSKQILWEKAETERSLCRDWLKRYVADGRPKLCTKAELCEAAIKTLGVSKYSFNSAWIAVIAETGRYDWYEPLRQRKIAKN